MKSQQTLALTLLVLLAFLFISSISKAQAKYARIETRQVPIERLLNNLEGKRNTAGNTSERALLEFQIGRLHSMAYALRTEEANVLSNSPASSGSDADVPYYGHIGEFNQFQVQSGQISNAQMASAKAHLQKAIEHMRQAVQLDPTLLQAKLGLAWCLDQAGQKHKAIPLYREVFQKAWEQEKSITSPTFAHSSIAAEAGMYLQQALDPGADAAEITRIKDACSHLYSFGRLVTPLLIPVHADVSKSDLMQEAHVTFDLDGKGIRAFSSWPTARAGWLVYDPTEGKKITSGLQLFGQSTFWIFWRDGYQALSALDDNNDGRLEGSELKGLSIWQDRNCNGISDADEVLPLASFGIESLSCSNCQLEAGMLTIKKGVTFHSGQTAPTYDWIVEECK